MRIKNRENQYLLAVMVDSIDRMIDEVRTVFEKPSNPATLRNRTVLPVVLPWEGSVTVITPDPCAPLARAFNGNMFATLDSVR